MKTTESAPVARAEIFELRAATPADRPALLAMYATFEPRPGSLGLPPRYGLEQWLDRIQSFPNLLLWDRERVVGHGILCPQDDSAEVAVFIHQEYRGRGLGTLLLSELVQQARRMGLRRLWGMTELDNVPMLRLARSLGFVSADDPRQFYLDLDDAQGNESGERPAA
ncbi:MAG: GNAT family N-acetyltransferase [Acidobacteriia bacterium]|nr:GNAT family N-acetyltransferase [Terriglobia bacterium]